MGMANDYPAAWNAYFPDHTTEVSSTQAMDSNKVVGEERQRL